MSSSSRRRAKIVCTLGPSSQSIDRLRSLVSEGMDVARLNFSHGSHGFHAETIENIRQVSQALGKPIALLQDLQGPKMRLGKLNGGPLQIKAGDVLLLYPEGASYHGSAHGKIPVPITAEYARIIAEEAQVGAKILFDDGKVTTSIRELSPPEITVEVENSGTLSDHKGMNLPGTPLSIPCLTEKDLRDLQFGLDQGVDAIALSFVRSPRDIEILREKIKKKTSSPPMIVAKIEREEALDHQEGIIELVDGLLIARGDMAVELGAERVPAIQKMLISQCNQAGVPVITATQMLESMIHSPTPTRAEASDVANAVFDGTDALMLSGETASGAYPVESVQTMVRIILEAERFRADYSRHHLANAESSLIVDAIEHSAARIAEQVDARAIACITHSGMAARALSKYRPTRPIVAIVDEDPILRKLCFVWGVQGICISEIRATDDLFEEVSKLLQDHGWAESEDLIVITAGIPTLRKGTTNTVKVQRIGASGKRGLRPQRDAQSRGV